MVKRQKENTRKKAPVRVLKQTALEPGKSTLSRPSRPARGPFRRLLALIKFVDLVKFNNARR